MNIELQEVLIVFCDLFDLVRVVILALIGPSLVRVVGRSQIFVVEGTRPLKVVVLDHLVHGVRHLRGLLRFITLIYLLVRVCVRSSSL